MVVLARLDERLIHGQVAIKWSRLLDVDRIVVADDEAAKSEMMQKTLMMAAPATVKVAIVSVDRAVALCNDPRSEQLRILLIVSSPESLLRVAREVKQIEKINVGNYGRVAPRRAGMQRKLFDANLFPVSFGRFLMMRRENWDLFSAGPRARRMSCRPGLRAR